MRGRNLLKKMAEHFATLAMYGDVREVGDEKWRVYVGRKSRRLFETSPSWFGEFTYQLGGERIKMSAAFSLQQGFSGSGDEMISSVTPGSIELFVRPGPDPMFLAYGFAGTLYHVGPELAAMVELTGSSSREVGVAALVGLPFTSLNQPVVIVNAEGVTMAETTIHWEARLDPPSESDPVEMIRREMDQEKSN